MINYLEPELQRNLSFNQYSTCLNQPPDVPFLFDDPFEDKIADVRFTIWSGRV